MAHIQKFENFLNESSEGKFVEVPSLVSIPMEPKKLAKKLSKEIKDNMDYFGEFIDAVVKEDSAGEESARPKPALVKYRKVISDFFDIPEQELKEMYFIKNEWWRKHGISTMWTVFSGILSETIPEKKPMEWSKDSKFKWYERKPRQ